jgi:hypothetical protein
VLKKRQPLDLDPDEPITPPLFSILVLLL